MNLGLLVFVVGLVGGITIVKEVGAPIMGLSLLLGLAVAADRLRSSDLRAATIGIAS